MRACTAGTLGAERFLQLHWQRMPLLAAAALRDAGGHLTIAVGQRTLLEDLTPCVVKFREEFPKTRFTFLQRADRDVAEAVEARQVDFGFTPAPLTEEQRRVLVAEPCYPLEIRLIAPRDHPLARRNRRGLVHQTNVRAQALARPRG